MDYAYRQDCSPEGIHRIGVGVLGDLGRSGGMFLTFSESVDKAKGLKRDGRERHDDDGNKYSLLVRKERE